eukprot:403374407
MQNSMQQKFQEAKSKIDEKRQKELQDEKALKLQRDSEFQQMKSRLFDLVDEILDRQNEKAEVLNFESFKVETASRKVLSELLVYFQTRDEGHDKNLEQMKQTIQKYTGRVDSLEKMLKKVQSAQLDTEQISKKVNKLEQKQEIAQESTERQVNSLKDMVNMVKGQFDNKLEIINVYDQRFSKLDKEQSKMRELIHAFRDQQSSEINDERQRIGKLDQFVNGQIDKLQQKIDNNKYFITKMNESISTLDTSVATFNSKLITAFDKLDSENDRRLLTEEFKKAMKQMNEFLMVKFREQDDQKNAIRDAFTYIKLYSPMQTQMMINESLGYVVKNQQLQVVDEERFYGYMQTRLDSLLQNIMLEKSRAEKLQGENGGTLIGDQLNEVLIKYAMPTEETGGYANVTGGRKHQQQSVETFISDLIKQQIDDARLRQTKQKLFSGGYITAAEQLRTSINLQEIQDIIDRVETKTEQQLKKNRKQTEAIAIKKKEKDEMKKRQTQREMAYQQRGGQTFHQKTHGIAQKNKVVRRTLSEVKLTKDIFNLNQMIKQKRNPSRIVNKFQVQDSSINRDQNQARAATIGLITSQENFDLNMENILPFMDNHARTISLKKEDFQNFIQSQYKLSKNKLDEISSKDKLKNDRSPMKIEDELKLEDQSQINLKNEGRLQDQNVQRVQFVDIDEEKQQHQDEGQRMKNQQRQDRSSIEGAANFAPGKLTKLQRKKLVQELKEEIQAIMASSVELKVSEQTASIQNQIRKIEMDLMTQNTRVSDRFTKDLDDARARFNQDFQEANAALIEDIKYLKKQRARDKSDFDVIFQRIGEKIKGQKKVTDGHTVYFEAIAQILSMTLESINMQMYTEEQDSKDKQKMALVGAKDKRLKIQELHGTTHEKFKKENQHMSIDDSALQDQSKSTQMGYLNQQKQFEQTARSNSNDSNQNQQNQTSNFHKSKLSYASNALNQTFTKKVRVTYPIKIDQTCLSCQVSGHDTQQILHMFKVACLSYQPSDVRYRKKKFNRDSMLSLRKSLMERCIDLVQKTGLFKSSAFYPKRYFDDLILEDSLMQTSLMLSNRQNQSVQIEQGEPSSHNTTTFLAFGIGQKQQFNQAFETMNNTTSTFNNQKDDQQDHLLLENKYKDHLDQSFNNSRNGQQIKPVKAIQGLSLSIKKEHNESGGNSKKLGNRNFSIQNTQDSAAFRATSNFTTRNLNLSTIDQPNRSDFIGVPSTTHNTFAHGNPNRNNSQNYSMESSGRKPNFDIEEIIKNPNAEIKKYAKAYQMRQINQSPQSQNTSGLVYPNIGSTSMLDNHKIQTKRPQVSTTLGFQDLPRIKQ